MAYVDLLARQRLEMGLAPLSREEEANEWQNSVDLIMEDDTILIRPDPDNMELAFRADELLQQLVPKHRVRFLLVRNEKVRDGHQAAGRVLAHQPAAQDARRDEADDRRLEDRHPRPRVVLLQQDDRHAISDLSVVCPAWRAGRAGPAATSGGNPRVFGRREPPRAAGSGVLHGRRRLLEGRFRRLRFRRPRCRGAAGAPTKRLRQKFCDAVPAEFRRDDLNQLEWRNRDVRRADRRGREGDLRGIAAWA